MARKRCRTMMSCLLLIAMIAADGMGAKGASVSAGVAAQGVKAYLNANYGKFMLSGQYAESLDAPEILAVCEQTGKYPAVMGFDLLYHGHTARRNGKNANDAIQGAIDWWNQGGLVTLCWHWFAPKDNLLTREQPWYKSFYSEATNFDLEKAMSGQDDEGYRLLLSDIDTAAEQLKKLRSAGVPVLWRPLHEASGGWFWWGRSGPDAYRALWNLMYDRMVNHHQLDHLIWVWNGQHADWYPGDDTVDIIGEDIYAEPRDYSAQKERFDAASAYTDQKKPVALSETGVIPDVDGLLANGFLWSWFCAWSGEYVVGPTGGYSEAYTSAEMLYKAYNHPRVITLDELPDFS